MAQVDLTVKNKNKNGPVKYFKKNIYILTYYNIRLSLVYCQCFTVCHVPDAALHQLKIAAAITVLRSKPAGATARQHTEQLCANYLQAQIQWRSRYLQAQDALVHLKQQLVICSTQRDQGK